jgi:hypothetical protein
MLNAEVAQLQSDVGMIIVLLGHHHAQKTAIQQQLHEANKQSAVTAEKCVTLLCVWLHTVDLPRHNRNFRIYLPSTMICLLHLLRLLVCSCGVCVHCAA